MSAEQLVTAPQGPSNGSAATLSDDDLLDALNAERAARAKAEQLYRDRDADVGRLQIEMRDLARLRDNFHSLYREERELRTESDRIAAERSEERDHLESEVALLRSSVEHLERSVAKLRQRSVPALEAPAPSPGGQASPTDTRIHELERDMGLLRAHAAELEGAVAQRAAELATAAQRVAELEREVAIARTQLAGSDGTDTDTAASRRIHDLEGELASVRLEHADMTTARDRIAAARDSLREAVAAERSARENAERFVAGADQRIQEATVRESEATRVAAEQRVAAERAEQDLAAARATIAVLEKRVHDAEMARATAEQRSTDLSEELAFVQSNVLSGQQAAPVRRGGLLRRREHAGHPAGSVETVGTPVAPGTLEVTGTPEEVEAALHRRLFGE